MGEQSFVFRRNESSPLTEAARSIEDREVQFVEQEVEGFAVVSQTCDIVRDAEKRPFVEVAPLIRVSDAEYPSIEAKKQPRFAAIPSLIDGKIVVDLDRVMTIEKTVLDSWKRISGCSSDEERREFSAALARKRARPALPDDFISVFKPLENKWKRLHKKLGTNEGQILRSLSEVRVQASPQWSGTDVELHFWFILDPQSTCIFSSIEQQVQEWMNIPKWATSRFSATHRVTSYEDLSAAEYKVSVQLDYDHLSD